MHRNKAVGLQKLRLRAIGGKPTVYFGKAELTAREIVERLNPVGLHLAFLDPYKLESLPFSVIATLAELKYIDLFIHVSVHDLQRNFGLYSKTIDGPLDRIAPGWRQTVSLKQAKSATRAAYIRYWASKVEALGFQPARYELVSGAAKNQRLYWLLLVSRDPIANRFWEKIRNRIRPTRAIVRNKYGDRRWQHPTLSGPRRLGIR